MKTLDVSGHIANCDEYLRNLDKGDRAYYRRARRYGDVIDCLVQLGLTNDETVVDVGAGWTEFDFCLRTTAAWKGRYIPVDGSHDGVDLEVWSPPRQAEYFVCLELLEHLENPRRLLMELRANATKGVFISTPNPATTDVLGMDSTHKTPIHMDDLLAWGAWQTWERTYYGKKDDSLFCYFRGQCSPTTPLALVK